MKTTAPKTKRPPRKTKSVKTVPNLDIMALSERISYLEEVLGLIVHAARTPGYNPEIFKNIKLNPKTKALV